MATIQKLLTDIAAIQSAGRAALADKGVEVSADATVYDIMQSIETIPAGGGTEYSSIEYDEATNTYTLAEKDDPTSTHTLTCSYDAQGRINGMVYDNKNISVVYGNEGTVVVGGTTVDVSDYPAINATVYDLPDTDSTVQIASLATIGDIAAANCAIWIDALDTTGYDTINKVNPTVAQLIYRYLTVCGYTSSFAYQVVVRGDYHGYIFGSKNDGCLIFTTPRTNTGTVITTPFLAILNMSDGNFTTCSVCTFGG